MIFLPCPSQQGQLGICFEASTMGLFKLSPMPTLFSLPLHSPVRVAEQKQAGAGEGHAKALEHPR